MLWLHQSLSQVCHCDSFSAVWPCLKVKIAHKENPDFFSIFCIAQFGKVCIKCWPVYSIGMIWLPWHHLNQDIPTDLYWFWKAYQIMIFNADNLVDLQSLVGTLREKKLIKKNMYSFFFKDFIWLIHWACALLWRSLCLKYIHVELMFSRSTLNLLKTTQML